MGKLNILHHKSWHVYKRDNRLRVLKDEEEAKKLSQQETEKKLKSTREERLNALLISQGKEENFTLFPVQDAQCSSISKKDEIKQDPWIMKLGETKSGEKSDPWYSKSDVKEFTKSDQYSLKELPKSYSSKMSKEKDEIIKFKQDPLRKIKESREAISKGKAATAKSGNSIEDLRRKRIEREKSESEKAKKLLTGSIKDLGKSKDYKLHENEQGYYHSQFNRDSRRKRT